MLWSEVRSYDTWRARRSSLRGRREVTIGALLASVLLCTGCGFELRGASTLPERIGALYVIGNTAIADYIEVAMVGGDVRMVNVPEEADLRVTLHGERFDQRVLSVDPDTGKEREFELTYTLELSAVDRAGKTVLSRQNLVLTRDYIFDRDAVIGSSREAATLYTDMRKDAVRQLLYRLRAELEHSA